MPQIMTIYLGLCLIKIFVNSIVKEEKILNGIGRSYSLFDIYMVAAYSAYSFEFKFGFIKD